MKRLGIFFILSFVLFYLDAVKTERIAAQEQRSERRDRSRERGDRSDRPPFDRPSWMQGGENPRPPRMSGNSGNDRPPWMGRNIGSGGEPSRQNSTERNERSLGMLRSMDTNGNGKLELNEIPEYRRGFVSMIVTQMGGDPNKTIDLAELARKASTSARSSQRSTSSTSSGNSSDSARQTAAATAVADPLVPYFGENEEPQLTVLAFGQREPQEKTTVTATTNSVVAVSQSDRILRSAREIMNKYDKNKNGTLDKDKNEWMSSLPFKTDIADKNRDGRISMTELLDTLGGKVNVTTGAAAVSTKQSEAYDRLPEGMPDWFFERDKDKDGQISMFEYANGQAWTEMKADEFQFLLDKNNDGVATVSEIIEGLRQYAEEMRLKEEQAKRDIERRKGVSATNSTAVPQPEGQPSSVPSPSPNQNPNSPSPSPPSAPSAATPPSVVPAGGVPSAATSPVTTSPSSPSETFPNWRPSGNVPATSPNTNSNTNSSATQNINPNTTAAPYSSDRTGSSDSERRPRNRSGYSRSRER
ncbi:MAG: hypothetical protein LBP87_11600 [Planctomycetaceae bacterium]|jgi:Ca2+-binding EF-hand superfamily protein|nr:hypothetical protein [Planctomycetaceae bacterium]